MPGPNGEKCGECYYWEPAENPNVVFGACRRFPPVFTREPQSCDTAYGFEAACSDTDDWCGEFKPQLVSSRPQDVELLHDSEAAELLKTTVYQLCRVVKTGALPFVAIPGVKGRVFRKSDLVALVNASVQRVTPEEPSHAD